jgi:hypothetical protein
MQTTVAALDKGYEFPPVEFELTPDWVSAYVAAVGDESIAGCGEGLVPPIGVAALAIRALLEHASLAPGTIHAAQEVAFTRAAHTGETLAVQARIASRGERAGWVLMGVDLGVTCRQEPIMTGRATITFPSGAKA